MLISSASKQTLAYHEIQNQEDSATMCQSYTTQRVHRPNLKAVLIQALAKPAPSAVENGSTTPVALGTQGAAPATTDPRNIVPNPPTPQKGRTPGTFVETESSVIPAWKLFAADW